MTGGAASCENFHESRENFHERPRSGPRRHGAASCENSHESCDNSHESCENSHERPRSGPRRQGELLPVRVLMSLVIIFMNLVTWLI